MHKLRLKGRKIDKMRGPYVHDPDSPEESKMIVVDEDADQSLFVADLSMIEAS